MFSASFAAGEWARCPQRAAIRRLVLGHLGLDLWKSGYKKGVPNPTRLRLGLGVVLSWISPCVFFRKPRPTLAGQGRVKSEKNAVGFGIICGITRG